MPCGQLKKLSGSQCCLISLNLSGLPPPPPKYACSLASGFQDIVREVEGSPLDHAVVTQIRLHFAQELSHAFLQPFLTSPEHDVKAGGVGWHGSAG